MIKQQAPNQATIRKKSDQPSEEFRKNESTMQKVGRTLDTSEQKKLNQTANTLDSFLDTKSSNENNRRKQTVQPNEENRQHESTKQKINRTLDAGEQQKFNQTSNMLNGSENKGISKKQMRLRRQFVQPSEEFREQKSTIQKIDRTLSTNEQRNLNQTSHVLKGSRNESSKKNRSSGVFHKQDTPEIKNEQTLNASKLQKDNQTDKLHTQGSKFKEKEFKLQKASSLGKETLKSGIEKYSDELEKDDEGVKLTSKSIRKVYKLSTKSFEKLKKKSIQKRNFKKGKVNSFNKEKKKESSLKKLTKIPASGLQKGSQKYQEELKKDDEGVKLVSESTSKIAKASKILNKHSKINSRTGKLNRQNSKLMQSSNKNKKLDIQTKAVLKKKNHKKRLYAPYRSKKSLSKDINVTTNIFNRITSYFKNTTLKISQVAKLIASKYIAFAGGGLAALIPIFLVAIICLVIAGIIGAGTSVSEEDNYANIGVSKNLSPNVERWRALVEKEAKAQGMESYVSLILAIIQVETGGTGNDIMQSSESAGLPVNSLDTQASIRQGIKHLKGIVKSLKGFGKGYENNTKLLAQAYNFGAAFATYVGKRGGEYTLAVAEEYSRTVVAPSLGNHNGATVPYINETSIRVGKTYRYVNGGNFLYGELVSEYLGGVGNVSGDFQKVLNEVEKYQGWEYVWGGKNPSTGFDCSGLVSWGLKQIGISLPSYAATQYQLTTPVSESEAQPGDLIFFKGTYGGANHISHVGFYVNRNTMYDSNGSGVGYHNWKDPYWQAHFAGIHRIK